MYTYVHVIMCIYVHVYLHTYVHVYLYTYVHVYMCIYVHMNIYSYFWYARPAILHYNVSFGIVPQLWQFYFH